MSWIKTDTFIEDNNPWYNNGVCNNSIKGTNGEGKKDGIGRPGANVLDNCVGFANGAFNETYFRNKSQTLVDLPKKEYFRFTCSANKIIPDRVQANYKHTAIKSGLLTNTDLKNCFMTPDKIPPEGGLICWGGDACHTAYISEVIDENNIVILQSGWGTPSWTTRGEGGWHCNRKPVTRHQTKDGVRYENIWWFNSNGYKLTPTKYCQGFIANPAVTVESTVELPPAIYTISQVNATTINFTGVRNGDPPSVIQTQIYYKFDGQVSFDNKDGFVTTNDENFNINITKPRNAKSITLLPVQVGISGEMVPGEISYKELYDSYPCIQIIDNKTKKAIPHIYNEDAGWQIAIPTIREKREWYEIYNTDKERVDK